MGRAPCCDVEADLKKGPWTPEEDRLLKEYVEKHGNGSWRRLPKLAGLNRCGKSCRLRWTNYLRPGIKRGKFSKEEEKLIINLHSLVGNKWSSIAARLPGRTDNEIKNFWNTHMRKKLLNIGIDPVTHKPRTDLNLLSSIPSLLLAASNIGNLRSHFDNALKLQADAANLAKLQLLQGLLQVLTSGATTTPTTTPNLDLISALMGGSPQTSLWNKQYEGIMLNSNSNLSGLAFMNPLNGFLNGDGAVATVPVEGSSSSGQVGLGSNSGASAPNMDLYTPLASNLTPSLVSASPASCGGVNPINSDDGSIGESPTSAPFDGWESLNLDDLNTELGWKDVLKQISWLNT